jgi:aldehyde dehydrogenase (NAD+)
MSSVTSSAPNIPFVGGGAKKLLIGGGWVDAASGRTMPSTNPSTGEVLVDVPDADAEDVNRAVAAARAAFEGPWRTTTPAARQRLLWKVADVLEQHYAELKVLTAADMGMPVGRDPRSGAEAALDVVRYFAGWATKISGATLPNSVPGMLTYTRKEPVGVVGAYVPFNSPFTQFVKKLGAVLATGSTMVVKPAIGALVDRLPNLRLDPDAEEPKIIGMYERGPSEINVIWD